MQFGSTDITYLVRKVSESVKGEKKSLYFAFGDLEKAFDCAPCAIMECSLRELVIKVHNESIKKQRT